MAAIQKENPLLSRAIADFEKELIKASNFLNDNSASFAKSLRAINEKAAAIEQMTGCDEIARKTFENAVAARKMLEFYSQFCNSLSAMKKSISEAEEQNIKTAVFLESFRRERTYSFESMQKAADFISQSFSLYSIGAVNCRPEFLGVFDMKELASQLQIKQAKQLLLVEITRLPALLDFLKKKNALRNFLVESAEMRVFIKNPLQARIEADNSKIKRLDRLAKELGAKLE